MAGREYCQSREPMGFVPSSVGMCCRICSKLIPAAKLRKKVQILYVTNKITMLCS
jgi:hypothetical protein